MRKAWLPAEAPDGSMRFKQPVDEDLGPFFGVSLRSVWSS
jgi:hypothetical protein